MSEPANVDRRAGTPVQISGMAIPMGVSVVVVLVGIFFFDQLPLLLLAGIVLAGGLVMLRWPDLTTLVGIGLVYTNLPVVAVRFHGAPSVLPAAVLAMFVWPLFFRLYVRREKLLFLSACPFLVVFAVVQLIGALFARDPEFAFHNFVSFALEGALVYFLMTNLIRTRRLAIASFWVLAASAILMGGVPMLQQLTGNFDTNYGGLAQADSQFRTAEDAIVGVVRQQRAAGTIGEQNRYAQFLILLAPISLSLIAIARSTRLRLFAVAAAIAALVGFALAFSRGAAVGLVLAFCVAVWLKLISRNQIKLVLIGVAFVLFLLPQYLTRLSSLGAMVDVVDRSDSRLDRADGAIRGRLTEMGAGVLAFRDHPLIGMGPGMFQRYSQEYGQVIGLRSIGNGREAHSMPVGIAADHGIFGLFSIAGVFVAVIFVLMRARRNALANNDQNGRQLATGILLTVILYLTTGLFLHLSYIRYFWLLIGLADAIGHIVVDGDRGETYLPTQTHQLPI